MNAYCNDVAREFLSDVNKLCSADGEIRDDEEEESHMAVLVEYLMNGRGHLLLSTLHKTVDQVCSMSYMRKLLKKFLLFSSYFLGSLHFTIKVDVRNIFQEVF